MCVCVCVCVCACAYRIHILEKRLKRHEEQALHKYYELDHKLRADSRLAALLTM